MIKLLKRIFVSFIDISILFESEQGSHKNYLSNERNIAMHQIRAETNLHRYDANTLLPFLCGISFSLFVSFRWKKSWHTDLTSSSYCLLNFISCVACKQQPAKRFWLGFSASRLNSRAFCVSKSRLNLRKENSSHPIIVHSFWIR